MRLRLIDRYLLSLSLGTLGSVVGIIMSLMVLEHIPRLIDVRNGSMPLEKSVVGRSGRSR